MAKTKSALVSGDFIKRGALRIGRTAKTLAVDMGDLAAPVNVYDADVSWAELSQRGTVSLFFGKIARGREALKTRIELRYPLEDFVNHFWRNSREFHEKLRQYVAKWPAVPPPPDTDQWVADKDHSEWVNFDYVAFSGTEGTLDFYHMPPTGIAMYQQLENPQSLVLNPVVRVLVTSFELLRLLDACAPIAQQILEYLPEDQRRAEPEASESTGEL